MKPFCTICQYEMTQTYTKFQAERWRRKMHQTSYLSESEGKSNTWLYVYNSCITLQHCIKPYTSAIFSQVSYTGQIFLSMYQLEIFLSQQFNNPVLLKKGLYAKKMQQTYHCTAKPRNQWRSSRCPGHALNHRPKWHTACTCWQFPATGASSPSGRRESTKGAID